MRPFFRLVLWLLITLLSLQGSAALAAGQAEQPMPDAMVMTCHAVHRAAAPVAGEHCDKSGAHGAHAKCAACAGGCVGAAPPALAPAFHAAPLVSSLPARPEAAMTSIDPLPLKRPPRASFV